MGAIPIPDLHFAFGGGPSQATVDGGAISNEGYTGNFTVGSGSGRQNNAHPVTNSDTSSGPSLVPTMSSNSFFGWQTILAVGAVIAVLVVIKKKL